MFAVVALWTRNSLFVGARNLGKMKKTRGFANVPLFSKMSGYGESTAVIDQYGNSSYKDILREAGVLGEKIKEAFKKAGNISRHVMVHNGIDCGPRVAFLCPNDVSFAVMVCAIWQSGAIAVPLCKTHPIGELQYVTSDSQVSAILSTKEYSVISQELARELNIVHIELSNYSIVDGSCDIAVETIKDADMSSHENVGAMILYTSGTTGRPKGVLLTHGNIQSQILSLIEAWEWSYNDSILHVLPLHHMHGIINVSLCSLWAGAACYMLPTFDAKEVWKYILNDSPNINLFMAVPTIFSKLLQAYNEQNYTEQEKEEIREKCKKFRLMVSGSAALPEPVLNEWETITGIQLLERYGMTEIGMALSNPLHGRRLPGHVGSPLPNVKVRIVARTIEQLESVVAEGNQQETILFGEREEWCGDLDVMGPSVFKMYWNKADATKEAFTAEGWFKTGDAVACQNNCYKILGRTSVDIIKSGGYKISALDIEDQLLTHPHILECAVVGVPDLEWGQRIAALVTCTMGEELSLNEIKTWARGRMIGYHIPSVLKCVERIPRNAMGKVNKKQLLKKYFEIKEL